MASTVNIGTLQGVLSMQGAYKAEFDKFKAEIRNAISETQKLSKTTKSESDKIREAYNKVAASLDPTVARTQKYEKAVETLNRALKAGVISQSQYNAQLLKAQAHLQTTTHWTQRLGASIASDLSSQLGRWFAISAAISLVAGTMKKLVDVTIEKEQSERLLEAAIKRSSAASDISSRSAIELAESLSRITGVDDDLIIAAEAVALRYNRISSQVFPAVTKAALDLAAATGKDLSSAMEFVAKMVNNPLRALTLLNREGYAVGKSQSDLIKHLLATNDILGAQGEILEILQSRYGGTAAEMRDTMGGALTALGTSWENLLEKMGEDHTGPIRDTIETIVKLLDFLTDHIDHAAIAWNEFTVTLIRGDMIIQKLRGLAGADDAAKKSADLRSQLAEREAGLAKLYAAQMVKQGLLSKELAEKLGLLATGHKKGSVASLEQTEAESKLNDEFERASRVVQQVYDDIGKLLDQALDQISLYNAAIQGQKALNEEIIKQKVAHAILIEENKLRAIGKTLTADQRKQIELSIRTTEEFDAKTKLLVQSWAKLKSLSNIEIKLPDLSKVPTIQQSVMEIGVSIHATVNDEFRQDWEDFAASVRESIKTDAEAIEEYELRVKIARDLARQAGDLQLVIDLEKELGNIRRRQVENAVNDWTSFANTLAGLFGGLFSKIASALNRIKAAGDAGGQLGGLLQQYAGAGAWAGSLRMYAMAFQAFYELTKAWTARSRAIEGRRFGRYEATAQMEDSRLAFSSSGAGPGDVMLKTLRATLDGVLSAIGGFLVDLPSIEIKIRNDAKKFQAYVAGVWIGTFGSAEEALGAAISQALSDATFAGVGKEIIQALEQSIGASLEELQHNLEVARKARDLRLGSTGAGLVENVSGLIQLAEAMERLGLSIEDVLTAIGEEFEATKARVLGIDMSTSEQLKAIRSLNEGMAEAGSAARAMFEREIADIQQQMANLQLLGPGGLGGAGTGGGGGGGGEGRQGGYTKDAQAQFDALMAELQTQLDHLYEELGKIPEALSDVEINMGIFDALYKYLEGDKKYAEQAHKYALMKVEIEFAMIKAQLILLGKWEEFAAMFDDALAAARETAGRTGRGGGGGRVGERQSAREFVADRRFELSLVGMSDLRRARAEITKQYDELIAQAGKDKKLREDLINLRAQEIALLEKEERARVSKEVQEFIAPLSEFGKIRETASGFIKDIENSPFGSARRAAMIGKVIAELDKQITRLSQQEAAGLFGSMLNDMQKFGISEQQMSKFRRSMAILEHTLNVENYRTRIAILKAEGNLAPAILAQLEDAFGIVSGIDVGKWFDNAQITIPDIEIGGGGDFSAAVDNVQDNLNRLAEAFKDAKDDIRDLLNEIARGELGIVAPEAAFSAAREQYNNIIARARSGELVGFQESSEAARNYIEALKAFSPELAATELLSIQHDLAGLLNITTVKDENLIYTEKFIKAQEETNKTLTAGFVDLSNQSHESTQIQGNMLSELSAINDNQAELLNRLSALENARYGNKVSA